LRSEVRQTIGVFDLLLGTFTNTPNIFPSSTRQNLDYKERSFHAALNQLLSEDWAVGAQYSFDRAELQSDFPTVARVLPPSDIHADLHKVNLSLLWNHPSGFFAQVGWDWYFQTRSRAIVNSSLPQEVPGETFQQLNLSAGYRFPRQRGDVTVGVLNATGEDYRLNPVTPYAELPREAAFYTRLRFRF